MKRFLPAAVITVASVVALTFRVAPMFATLSTPELNISRKYIVGVQFKWLWLTLFEMSYQIDTLNQYWIPVVADIIIKCLLVILIILQVWQPVRYFIRKRREELTGE